MVKNLGIRGITEKKLRAIIKNAYENTEFYHRKLKTEGIRPDDIRTVEDFR